MSAVAAAVGGGAIIGAIASNNAANTEAGAASNASNTQQYEFNQQQANLAPYLANGQAANAILANEEAENTNAFTMADFQEDPGYQFQLAQGQQAVQRSAAASGMLNSVGTQENLDSYTQGLANTDYQQALTNFTNNQQQRYNMLAGIANMGLGATGQVNSAGQNMANNVSQAQIGAGNAQAAGSVGIANAATGAANNFMGYSSMNNLANRLAPQPQLGTPQSGSVTTGYDSSGVGTLGVNTNLASNLTF